MPQHITRGYKAMLDEANAVIETIPAADAVKRFPQGGSNIQDTVIVDLRDPREIEREGRIPGAFSCPRGMLEFWIDPASPYAKPIFQEDKKFVFHCASGWRSALAAKAAQEMGLKPVAVESHNAEDKDFSAQLGRLRDAGAQMVILWTHDNESALIVRQAKQLGLPMKFAGSTSLSQPVFVKLAGDAAEGAISSSDFVPSDPDPKTQAFAKKYQQQYHVEAELYAATYYDATYLAAKAIEMAGGTEPAKVREAFGKLQYSGILGDYKCEADGDCNHQILIVEIQKGAPVVKTTVRF